MTTRPEARRSAAVAQVGVRVVAAVSVVAALWYGVLAVGLVEQVFLPPPHRVLAELVSMLGTRAAWEHARATLTIVAWGYAMAIVGGVGGGVVLGTVPLLRRALTPYLGALQSLPKVVFAPLLIGWLGFGSESKRAIGATVAVLPIVINTMVGMQAHGHHAARLMTAYGASPWKRFRLLRLPAALPFVFVGLRQGVVLAFSGTILAEVLVGTNEGFGYLVKTYTGQILMDRALAAVIMITAFALAVSIGLKTIERWVIHWRGHEVT